MFSVELSDKMRPLTQIHSPFAQIFEKPDTYSLPPLLLSQISDLPCCVQLLYGS